MGARSSSRGAAALRPYQAEYDRLRARAQTERYQAVRRGHPKVERKLSEIVQQHGGRRTRYRGRWRVKIQHLLLGLVVNIERMVKCLLGGLDVARPCPAGA